LEKGVQVLLDGQARIAASRQLRATLPSSYPF
jgi:hypothetical protein